MSSVVSLLTVLLGVDVVGDADLNAPSSFEGEHIRPSASSSAVGLFRPREEN